MLVRCSDNTENKLLGGRSGECAGARSPAGPGYLSLSSSVNLILRPGVIW